MDFIRLFCLQIPSQVENIVRILVKGSDQDIKSSLPTKLTKIDRNVTECLALAEAVEKKFEFVMDLTGELDEVFSSAQGYYQEEQEETRKKREIALIKEKEVRDQVAEVKKQRENLEKQVRKAKEGFEKAVNSMPGTLGLVGMHLIETMTNVVAKSASAVLLFRLKVPSFLSDNLKEDDGTKEMQTVGEGFAEVQKLENLINYLVECLSTDSHGVKAGKDSGGKENLSEKLKTTRIYTQQLENDLPTEDKSETSKQLSALLKEGLRICEKAEKLTKQPKEMKAMHSEALEIQKKVRMFCTKTQVNAGCSPLYTRPPRQAKAMASAANSASSSIIQTASENARFMARFMARGILEREEDRYDKASEDLHKKNKKLSEVLQELGEFTREKMADFEEIRKILRLGIQALALLRERWQKLVAVFQFVTNIIKVCQTESLKSFAEYAEEAGKLALTNDYSGSDFMRDIMYEQVTQAKTTSFAVWSISNMYVEISSKYLMDRMAGLGHMIALDPENDRPQIEMKTNELIEGSKKAPEEIKSFLQEAQDQYHKRVAKRKQKIESTPSEALPPEDPARIKEIEDIVNKAIKGADEFGPDKF